MLAALRQRGVDARLLETPGAPPAVYGVLSGEGAHKTIGLYAHYDGQPVDPAQWTSPPFSPVVREGRRRHDAAPGSDEESGAISLESRIYARSSSDDKGAIEAMLIALDVLRAQGDQPSTNIKFLLEGEEEVGSPHLAETMTRYADLLRVDLWLLCDGPVHPSGRPQLFFGVRGIVAAELTVYGPNRELHSGHFGNWAPNPILRLAELLRSMRDTEGRILIPGFYANDRPLTPAEEDAIRAAPSVDDDLRDEFAIARTESYPEPLNRRVLEPALNIVGIRAGEVGPLARNAIPTEATAAIDFRLVPDQTPDGVRALVEDFIANQGYYVVHSAPTADQRRSHARLARINWASGYPAARTALSNPLALELHRVVTRATSSPVVVVPSLGGSVPMYQFSGARAATPTVGVPIANYDNNQHAADENLRIGNLWNGVAIFFAVMTGFDADAAEQSAASAASQSPADETEEMGHGRRPSHVMPQLAAKAPVH